MKPMIPPRRSSSIFCETTMRALGYSGPNIRPMIPKVAAAAAIEVVKMMRRCARSATQELHGINQQASLTAREYSLPYDSFGVAESLIKRNEEYSAERHCLFSGQDCCTVSRRVTGLTCPEARRRISRRNRRPSFTDQERGLPSVNTPQRTTRSRTERTKKLLTVTSAPD